MSFFSSSKIRGCDEVGIQNHGLLLVAVHSVLLDPAAHQAPDLLHGLGPGREGLVLSTAERRVQEHLVDSQWLGEVVGMVEGLDPVQRYLVKPEVARVQNPLVLLHDLEQEHHGARTMIGTNRSHLELVEGLRQLVIDVDSLGHVDLQLLDVAIELVPLQLTFRIFFEQERLGDGCAVNLKNGISKVMLRIFYAVEMHNFTQISPF